VPANDDIERVRFLPNSLIAKFHLAPGRITANVITIAKAKTQATETVAQIRAPVCLL